MDAMVTIIGMEESPDRQVRERPQKSWNWKTAVENGAAKAKETATEEAVWLP